MHVARSFKGWFAAGVTAAVVGGLTLAAVADAAVVQPQVTPTWQTNGRVNAITVVGTTAYIGGKFTSVRPAGDPLGTGEVARNHAAAINLTTGAVLPWNPNANGTVQAIAVSGTTVYIGGSFTKIGTTGRTRIAAVNNSSGALITGWKATLDAEVMTLQTANGMVYAGGAFTTVNGASRANLVALNGTTGATVSTWNGTADGSVLASTLAAGGTKLVIGGNFTHVDGSSQNHIAAVSPTTGATIAWSTHTPYAVIGLDSDTAGVYVAGAGNGGNFAAFDPSNGKMKWQGGTNGNIQAITVLNGEVYPGGHYTDYCGPQKGSHTCTNPIPRSKILAVDELTGALQPWAPSVNSVLGIFSMAGGNNMLSIGGDFTKVAGVSQQGFAVFHS